MTLPYPHRLRFIAAITTFLSLAGCSAIGTLSPTQAPTEPATSPALTATAAQPTTMDVPVAGQTSVPGRHVTVISVEGEAQVKRADSEPFEAAQDGMVLTAITSAAGYAIVRGIGAG